MADAVPVHSNRGKKIEVAPEVTVANPSANPKEHEAQKSELLAKARAIVEAERPDVPDELVNSLGQGTSYGKFKSVTEVVYPVIDRRHGEPTGENRIAIRIDH